MRARKVESFRVNPTLWKRFKTRVQQQGFSTCFALETLIRAYLTGTDTTKKVNKSSTITINQKIDYVVRKPRRQKGGWLENCYKNGVWVYEKPDSKSDLRSNGHHISCACASCRTHPASRALRLSPST